LVLRFWEASDAPGMLQAMVVSRPTLLPWMSWALKDNRTLEECIFNIEKFRREREKPECDSFAMGMFDRTTGEPVGGTGFHRLKPEHQQAEIGYWVRADRRRQGLCTEAVRHLISWGFAQQAEGGWGLRRIEIFCAAQNAGSRGVPTKIGLRHEYEAVEARWVEGVGWEDTLGWGVLEREWDREGHGVR
jgi:RimJ/RimL family protein N-acetyltransferase